MALVRASVRNLKAAVYLVLAVALPLQAQTLKPSSQLGMSVQDRRMVQRAEPYMPSLKATIDKYWTSMEYPPTVAAQIEKESLWNPKAELCVPKGTCAREYGFGFGQLTITPRFNVFEEIKALHPDLRQWKYADRFDTTKQMTAIVVKDRLHFKQCLNIMLPGVDTYACGFSAYNGGYGGVTADRRLCANTSGCDPRKWFGNVERVSLKAKTAQAGYGQSFFEVNRGYVKALIFERPGKYTIFPGFEQHP